MIEFFRGRVSFLVIYIASFLYALHYALPLYIFSNFLEGITEEKMVGVIYASGSLVTVLFILYLPRILRRFGIFNVLLTTTVLQVASLLGLAYLEGVSVLVALFIWGQVTLNTLYVLINILLESFSKDNTTGSIRGVFLTIINIAILIAPFLAGMILTDHNFGSIFLTAAIILAAMFPLIFFTFRGYNDPPYKDFSFKTSLAQIKGNKNLYGIFVSSFLLNFFYAWMIIYTPLYLHQTLGIPLSSVVGIIIPVALIPFVLSQIFLGRLADTRFGEKEMLIGGFLLMGISTGVLALVTSPSVLLWAGLLFITRIGASAVEEMSESYFYKQIDGTDTHLITLFRNLAPLSFLVAPVAATIVFLGFGFDYRFLFVILGMLMLLGVRYALMIKDTR